MHDAPRPRLFALKRLGPLLLVCIAFFSVTSAKANSWELPAEWQDMIFPPTKSKEGNNKDKLLVIIPAGATEARHYQETVNALQTHTQTRLWVAVLNCAITANRCNPIGETPLSVGVMFDKLRQRLRSENNASFANEDIFIAGHSLGAVSAYTLGNRLGNPAGIMLWASIPWQQLSDYRYPIMTVTGDMDRKLPPSALIKPYGQLKALLAQHPNQQEAVLFEKPVFLIPGINHNGFTQDYRTEGDNEPELQGPEAMATIAALMASFMHQHLGDQHTLGAGVRSDSADLLRGYWLNSRRILEPLHTASLREESGLFCLQGQKDLLGSALQHQLADRGIRLSFDVTVIKNSWEAALRQPKIWIQEAHDEDGIRTAHIMTHSYAPNPWHPPGAGTNYVPKEVTCKWVTPAALMAALATAIPEGSGDWVQNQQAGSCRQTNKETFQRALRALPTVTQDRYTLADNPVRFLDDIRKRSYGGGITRANLVRTTTDDGLEVRSPVVLIKDRSTNTIHQEHCKLFGPARAMEWILTESLPLVAL